MKNKKLQFNGLLDFYPNKENLKELYECLTTDERYLYKMYVYSLPFMDDDIKDLIWEYLNDNFEDGESKFNLANKYRLLKNRVEKRKVIEIYNTEETTQLE